VLKLKNKLNNAMICNVWLNLCNLNMLWTAVANEHRNCNQERLLVPAPPCGTLCPAVHSMWCSQMFPTLKHTKDFKASEKGSGAIEEQQACYFCWASHAVFPNRLAALIAQSLSSPSMQKGQCHAVPPRADGNQIPRGKWKDPSLPVHGGCPWVSSGRHDIVAQSI